MQVDLFKDDYLSKRVNRRVSYIKNRSFSFSSSVDSKNIINNVKAYCNIDDEFLSSILDNCNKEKLTCSILGSNVDSHFNIETLNLSSYSKSFVVIYSIQDLLPLILNLLCGCDVSTLNARDGIKEVSRDLLELRYSQGIKLTFFLGIDNKLDDYIHSLSSECNNESDVIKLFALNINIMVSDILKYLMTFMESYSPLGAVTIDKSKLLFTSHIKEIEELILVVNDVKVRLNPIITDNSFGYFDNYTSFLFGEVV